MMITFHLQLKLRWQRVGTNMVTMNTLTVGFLYVAHCLMSETQREFLKTALFVHILLTLYLDLYVTTVV